MRIISIKKILVLVLFCLFYDDANICSNDAIESGFGPVTTDIAKTSFNLLLMPVLEWPLEIWGWPVIVVLQREPHWPPRSRPWTSCLGSGSESTLHLCVCVWGMPWGDVRRNHFRSGAAPFETWPVFFTSIAKRRAEHSFIRL